MVFNPNLDGGVRFDQPVQQPTSPVANIVQGLGIFNRREAASPTVGQQFDAAVAHMAEEMGVSTDVSSWTEQNLRGGGAMYPQFASRLYGIADDATDRRQNLIEQEELEGGGAPRLRAIAVRDWSVEDPNGIVAELEANELYPDDPTARAAHVERRFLSWNIAEAERQELIQERDRGAAISDISQDIWDTELNRLQVTAAGYASIFASPEVMARLLGGEGVRLSEVAPQLAAMLGEGGDMILRQGTLTTQLNLLAPVIANQILGQVRAEYSDDDRELNAPSSEFMRQALSPLYEVFTALDDETSPTQAMENARATDWLEGREQLREGGYLGAINTIGALPPELRGVFLQRLREDENFLRIFDRNIAGHLSGEEEFNPADGSVEEAGVAIETTGTFLNAFTGEVTPERLEELERMIEVLPASLRRTGTVLGNTYVTRMLDLLESNPSLDTAVSNTLREEVESQVGIIQGLVSRANGTLQWNSEAGQFVVTQGLVQEGMGTAPTMPTGDFEGQAQLDHLNTIMETIADHEALGSMGSDFIGAVTSGVEVDEGIFIEGLHTAPTGATLRNIEQGAPGYTESDRFARVYGSDDMTPAFYDDGTLSEAVREGADRRMHAVLTGPFQDAQNIFGEAIPINDALAQQGTTRVTQTPGSRHFHGDAVDISITGFSPERQMDLLEALLQAGFQGFGFGAGILHADMGARRHWNYLNDDMDSTAFGATPLRDLYTTVANNSVARADLPVTGASAYSTETVNILSNTEYSERGSLEFDPVEGLAQGMVYLDEEQPATVDQAPVGELSVGDDPNVEPTASEQGMPTAARRGNPQIERLIDEISGEVDLTNLDDDQIEEIRAAIAGALGLAPRQRPEGLPAEVFSRREGR
jgi:hypothetical protein